MRTSNTSLTPRAMQSRQPTLSVVPWPVLLHHSALLHWPNHMPKQKEAIHQFIKPWWWLKLFTCHLLPACVRFNMSGAIGNLQDPSDTSQPIKITSLPTSRWLKSPGSATSTPYKLFLTNFSLKLHQIISLFIPYFKPLPAFQTSVNYENWGKTDNLLFYD